jgi:hypothetical protein
MCGLAFACLSWPAPAHAVPERAKGADDFVESIGVNVHLGFSHTVYAQHDVIQDKLVELGLRHIRDGVGGGRPDVYRTMRALASRGIKVTFVVGDPLMRYGSGSLDEQLALVKNELLPAVEALEGPNEYNGNARDLDPNWAATLRDYQTRLYEQVKADGSLSKLPVLAPSLVGAEAHDTLGDLSRFLDYGNMHTYPGGAAPDRDWYLQYLLDLAAKVSGSKPVQATETGYHNAVNVGATFGHPPTSEEAAGIYMPRLYLEYFRRGFARTFAYELVDQWPNPGRDNNEANFGLLRNDFSEKPAFIALKRLIALLRDPGPRFTPETLDYAVDGAPPSLRQVLLQKRDGSFYLALWNQVSVWDQVNVAPLNPGGVDVRLVLGRAAQVEVYRPGASATPYESWRETSSLRLRVGADVVLVRLGSPGSWKDRPPAKRPASGGRGARRFLVDLGRARRGSRISIRWPAGRGRRYRISTSVGQRKFRRTGLARLRKHGRGVVRFRPRRVRFVRLVQVDRRPPAVGTISRRHVRLGGRRR